ncbi:MAG: PIN domain-containing protein [Chloroflexi bacterium]|nr:PIN domain-containing protein [Chloroflexota bacterium]
MIFVDTSAIYALANRLDLRHALATERFRSLLDSGERLLTHSYVLVEAISLLQRRLGVAAALTAAEGTDAFEVAWVDRELHAEALRRLAASAARRVSFVDQVSFAAMRRYGVTTALAFDQDFVVEGFRLYGEDRQGDRGQP